MDGRWDKRHKGERGRKKRRKSETDVGGGGEKRLREGEERERVRGARALKKDVEEKR